MFFISQAFNKFMLYLDWILFFLKNFLDYEKIDVKIQILKRHKLTLPPTLPPKRRSDVCHSKIDLRMASKGQKREKST